MRHAVRLCVVAAVLTVAASAAAQGQRSAAAGFMPGIGGQGQAGNKDQPIQIDARSLEVRDKKKTATFIGDVKVVQGSKRSISRATGKKSRKTAKEVVAKPSRKRVKRARRQATQSTPVIEREIVDVVDEPVPGYR